MSEPELRAKLEAEIAAVTWKLLRPHAADNRLFLVGNGLALLDAALAVAEDDSPTVQRAVDAGQLLRPSAEQIRSWETGSPGFRFVIVSPFVLAEVLVPPRQRSAKPS